MKLEEELEIQGIQYNCDSDIYAYFRPENPEQIINKSLLFDKIRQIIIKEIQIPPTNIIIVDSEKKIAVLNSWGIYTILYDVIIVYDPKFAGIIKNNIFDAMRLNQNDFDRHWSHYLR